MHDRSLITRLKRYGIHCISHALDPDFAEAVHDAIDIIESLTDDFQDALDMIDKLKDQNAKLKSTLYDCQNDLCYKCGDYKERHLGRCDGCRWYELPRM